MPKTIFITGATDGIGLAATRMLAPEGHQLLLHGRNPAKLEETVKTVTALSPEGRIESYLADLSKLSEVRALARAVQDRHSHLDVLINNAGVYKAAEPVTADGLDIRFAVNTLAPYLLTRQLLALMDGHGRVVNLSSAAQAPVELDALAGKTALSPGEAYAQSKLAITMWNRHLARALGDQGPVLIAVNPGSLLGSKMVRDAFGIAGGDIGKGAEILKRAALDEGFARAGGLYFDNDSGRFADPHPDALDNEKCTALVTAMETILEQTAH